MSEARDLSDLAEGYPPLTRILQRIVAESELADMPVYRLEVNTFANGEATYRAWAPGADEPEGGYLPAS